VVWFVREEGRNVVARRSAVQESPVVMQGQAAVGRIADHDGGERIAIDVAVVGQHAGGDHSQGRVFRGGVAVIGHNRAGSTRRIVDRCHGDVDGGGSAVGLTVVGFVSEAVWTVVVQWRDAGETHVIVRGQSAVALIADHDGGERITIDPYTTLFRAGGDHSQGRVFRGGVAVIGHNRAGGAGRIVDRRHGDVDGGGSAVGLT